MQIDKVIIHRVLLPFSIVFSHSLRDRSSAGNVIAEVIAEKGQIKGFGEGAPRSYVTGESQESAVKGIGRLTQQDNFPWQLNDVSQIWDFIDSLPGRKDHNAAVCALENALLDALGKYQNKSVIEYFPDNFYTDTVYYGAAIPLADKQKIIEFSQLIKTMQINKLKLKMGTDYDQNKGILEAVRLVFEDDCDIKVDVNGVWDRTLAIKHIPMILEYKVKVLEQPMMPGDAHLADVADLLQSSDVILMADESVCTLEHAKRISAQGCYGMVNVRLSKCGGFRNSLRLIDYLRMSGIQIHIGCHLGESGLLSAAGRALCLLCGDAVYCDGSYDEFLLKENITFENISFEPGGKATALNGPGLGVEVDPQSLARLSIDDTPVTLFRP